MQQAPIAAKTHEAGSGTAVTTNAGRLETVVNDRELNMPDIVVSAARKRKLPMAPALASPTRPAARLNECENEPDVAPLKLNVPSA